MEFTELVRKERENCATEKEMKKVIYQAIRAGMDQAAKQVQYKGTSDFFDFITKDATAMANKFIREMRDDYLRKESLGLLKE